MRLRRNRKYSCARLCYGRVSKLRLHRDQSMTELAEGDTVFIDVWNESVEIIELVEKRDEVLIEIEDGNRAWESLTWLNIKVNE